MLAWQPYSVRSSSSKHLLCGARKTGNAATARHSNCSAFPFSTCSRCSLLFWRPPLKAAEQQRGICGEVGRQGVVKKKEAFFRTRPQSEAQVWMAIEGNRGA